MTRRLKRSVRRSDDTRPLTFCCQGVIYTVTDKVLGAIIYPEGGIDDRLLRIDGLKVVGAREGQTYVTFPTLRLPEVAGMLVPLDSARAPAALAIAAHRGRIR